MLSSRVRVPAKDELDAGVMLSPALSGPCMCRAVCTILYPSFLFLRICLACHGSEANGHVHDHPGDCYSFGLRLPKLQKALPRCLMQVISVP